jgi:hypothetical protein
MNETDVTTRSSCKRSAPGVGRCARAVTLALAVASAPIAHAQPPAPDAVAAPHVDVAIAIDVSESTSAASGIDVDGDGVVGINPSHDPRLDGQYPEGMVSTDPDDSVLAAELAAVRALLATLRSVDARVAIVSFSGAVDPETGKQSGLPADNAQRLASLSATLDEAATALDEVAHRGPHGGTDFSAAIRAARHALCGPDARPQAERVLLLLTDGVPSLPHGFAMRTDRGDVSAAIEAAREASACGVRIDVFAIGPLAIGDPFAAKEVARVSQGRYQPIRQASGLRAALEGAFAASDADVDASGQRSSP